MPRFAYAATLMLLSKGVMDAADGEELRAKLKAQLTNGCPGEDEEWELAQFEVAEAHIQMVEVAASEVPAAKSIETTSAA